RPGDRVVDVHNVDAARGELADLDERDVALDVFLLVFADADIGGDCDRPPDGRAADVALLGEMFVTHEAFHTFTGSFEDDRGFPAALVGAFAELGEQHDDRDKRAALVRNAGDGDALLLGDPVAGVDELAPVGDLLTEHDERVHAETDTQTLTLT